MNAYVFKIQSVSTSTCALFFLRKMMVFHKNGRLSTNHRQEIATLQKTGQRVTGISENVG